MKGGESRRGTPATVTCPPCMASGGGAWVVGLAHPGPVLDEQVPLGEQGQYDQVYHRPLALDDPFDVGGDRVEALGEPGQFLLVDDCLSHGRRLRGSGLEVGQVLTGLEGWRGWEAWGSGT